MQSETQFGFAPLPTMTPNSQTPAHAMSEANVVASMSTEAVEETADSQAAKRGRRSRPKVKTGCSNCKQRRIKCDETRPACTQCVRSRKACTGYPPPPRGSRPFEEIRIAPKPFQAAPSVVASAPLAARPHPILSKDTVLPPRRANRRQKQLSIVTPSHGRPATTQQRPLPQPSFGLAFTQIEGMYFSLFRSQTASELSGYFDSAFWTQRVLQECHRETAIRHAVVALGALYKTLELSWEPRTSPGGTVRHQDGVFSHWQVAVKQYSEACNAIMVLNAQNQESYRTRLMATVLLACFDSFIGDHKQAIFQIQTGLGVLEQLHTDHDMAPVSSSPNDQEDELITVFTRLAIQAKSYDLAFHFPDPYVIRLDPHHQKLASSPNSDAGSPSTPNSFGGPPFYFSSVREARLASDKLNEQILVFLERLYAAKDEPSNVLPGSWKKFGMDFRQKLQAWHEAFEPIFQSRASTTRTYLEKQGIAALKMFQINNQVLFLMMFSSTEDKFDEFLPQFENILELGLEVVSDEEERARMAACPDPKRCTHQRYFNNDPSDHPAFRACHIKPSFSADLGIVAPLFVVATKCRQPFVRRQAIRLLTSTARREGMWDSELAARIGQWIMQVEEFESNDQFLGFMAGVPSTPIPEHKRIMVKSLDFDLRERRADLRVGTRGLPHGLPDERFRQTLITW